ncbi:SIMPL domain-containing protein [Paraflavisolibacter sp. H34]|uniref:SIMPL domain-containing protein n=1 Tax=Huijunlia imazamoxiresistens TaxID=3127457 RepID=UPI0030174648
MKKVFFSLVMVLFLFQGFAQTAQIVPNPFPRTLTVNGSAEMELVPDEIYVQVDLREYEKKGQGKIGLDKIKSDFLKATRSLGLPDSAITIASYDAFNGNPWLRKKNKKNEMYASINYLVKLSNSTQMDNLVEKLDDEATQNFFIERTGHSKLDQFRKQLKIQALKAAKDKAGYLAAAIDEALGPVVTINEPVEYYVPFYNARSSNVLMRAKTEAVAISADPSAPAVDFRKIKLKFDVTVVYALK